MWKCASTSRATVLISFRYYFGLLVAVAHTENEKYWSKLACRLRTRRLTLYSDNTLLAFNWRCIIKQAISLTVTQDTYWTRSRPLGQNATKAKDFKVHQMGFCQLLNFNIFASLRKKTLSLSLHYQFMGASAVSHRAEAWRNKAHSRTHHRAVHAPAALYSVSHRPRAKLKGQVQ